MPGSPICWHKPSLPGIPQKKKISESVGRENHSKWISYVAPTRWDNSSYRKRNNAVGTALPSKHTLRQCQLAFTFFSFDKTRSFFFVGKPKREALRQQPETLKHLRVIINREIREVEFETLERVHVLERTRTCEVKNGCNVIFLVCYSGVANFDLWTSILIIFFILYQSFIHLLVQLWKCLKIGTLQ